MDKKVTLVVPVMIVVVGAGWLLSTLGVVPEINWIWTLGLAVVGLMTFLLAGVDKFTAIVGPFFLLASCTSLLRQTGRLSFDVEVPMLVIASGVLMLVARMRMIPAPKWMVLQPPVDENE